MQWLELREVRRTEAAFQSWANEEVAEELARVLHEAPQALAKAAVASYHKLVVWVSTARDDFENKPRQLGYLVMQVPLLIR